MTFSSADRAALSLNMARWGVIGMAASMPISRAVFNLSALLMITGWLLSGDWANRLVSLRSNPPAVAATILFLIFATSLTWVEHITADHWSQLRAYSRLLFIPVIVTLLTSSQWQKRAWRALLTGMLITLIAYLLDIWFEVPGTGSYGTHTAGQGVFYHHIAQGMVLSFLGAYALNRTLLNQDTRSLRIFWFAVAISTLAGLIAVGQSRTGQVSVLIAYALVILLHMPKRWRIWGVLLTLLASGAITMSSPHMRERFEVAFQETTSFQQTGDSTSVGARLKAWEFSLDLIQQSPWLGHGIGSYESSAFQHFADSKICQLGVCYQPHNQFILTTFETGLVGLVALFAFLLVPMIQQKKETSPEALLALPFVAIFVVTACFDSSLKIQAQSFFTVTTLGILMASHYRPPSSRDGSLPINSAVHTPY